MVLTSPLPALLPPFSLFLLYIAFVVDQIGVVQLGDLTQNHQVLAFHQRTVENLNLNPLTSPPFAPATLLTPMYLAGWRGARHRP